MHHLQDLRCLTQQQPTRVLCLEKSQETAQTHHAALVTLQKQTVRLREEKERAERALQEMRVRHNETEAGAQVLIFNRTLWRRHHVGDIKNATHHNPTSPMSHCRYETGLVKEKSLVETQPHFDEMACHSYISQYSVLFRPHKLWSKLLYTLLRSRSIT